MVTNPRTLRALTKAGFIVWTPGSDRHWTGMQARRLFVSDGPKLQNWYDEFELHGRRYRLHYVDGCFHPFVFRVGSQVPSEQTDLQVVPRRSWGAGTVLHWRVIVSCIGARLRGGFGRRVEDANMHVYIHRIMVTVVTPECSPDTIERQIEDAIGTRENSVNAETDRENRMRSPSITIPNPPTWPTTNDKRDEAKYFTAYDTWRDEFFPRADAREVQAR